MEDGRNHQANSYLKRHNNMVSKVFKNIRPEPVEETADLSVSYHSTQINLSECTSEKDYRFHHAVSSLPDEHIFENHPYQTEFSDGREQKPHITVLYGLVNDKDYFPIRKVCAEHPAFEVEVGTIKAFRNDDSECDVLVHEILSDGLHQLNASLSQFENMNQWPDYKPHMTLSYVKKGSLQELEGQPTQLTGEKFLVKSIVFSHTDGYMLELPLGPEQQTAPTRE